MAENQYRNWVFTWNASDDGVLPTEVLLYKYLEIISEQFVFQKEQGEETKRFHYQGAFVLRLRKRKSSLLKEFLSLFTAEEVKNLTILKMEGSWDQAERYCTKEDTRVSGTQPLYSSNICKYSGSDISFFSRRQSWYPWQKTIYNQLFENFSTTVRPAEDRDIIWITDYVGNNGKSKFCKFLCHNSNHVVKVAFGNASQIRSSVIMAGAKKIYLLDIPRTLGDDSLESVISAIEDIKNGFVCSAFYGKYTTLLMETPHVVVFSNAPCPVTLMSMDRWRKYHINQLTKDIDLI